MDSGRVLSAACPTVLTPASPECVIPRLPYAALLRRFAVRSAPWGAPSAASRPESPRRVAP